MSILYCVSWTINSILRPSTPPAALISYAASIAPLAAGRSSADSSPVSAKPPPILIVSPDAAGALVACAPAAVGSAAAVVGACGAEVGCAAGAAVDCAAGPAVPHAAKISAATNVTSKSLALM